jgi:hypothetical protein
VGFEGKHLRLDQRWKKYFPFCQPGLMRRRFSAKMRDLQQHLKDTTDLFGEKQQLYLGSRSHNVSFCLLTLTGNINAFNY